MRITGSSLSMQSEHVAVSYARRETSIERWSAPAAPAPEVEAEDQVELSEDRLGRLDLKSWFAKVLLEAFSGRELALFGPGEDEPETKGQGKGQGEGRGAPSRRLSGIEIRDERVAYEAEAVHFAAQGVVTTADGRRIELAVQLDMSREHYERTSTTIAIGDERPKVDPLVIHMGGGPISLSGPKVDLDLDLDGQADRIATPGRGSGFLALDRDGDGVVTDGSELFGPRSGSGFGELAALDGDADGWIDEDDAAWAQLRVWDVAGGRMLDLREAGVGAISVASAPTPFSLGDTAATADGVVRETGVFLREDGTAGTVQHIDLAV